MAKGYIVVDEKLCKGCGLCAEFCSRGCVAPPADRMSGQGYLLPSFVDDGRCTGCGVCGQMCPDFAVTVYRLVGPLSGKRAGAVSAGSCPE